MRDASYYVKLVDPGPNEIRVIKFIKEHCRLGWYETRRAVDHLPWTIISDYGSIGRDDAMRLIRPLAEGLEALGATVEWDYDYGDLD